MNNSNFGIIRVHADTLKVGAEGAAFLSTAQHRTEE